MKYIEIRRNDDALLNEIVAKNATIHLEQMDNMCWWLRITHDKETIRIFFNSRSKLNLIIDEYET
jgi:hypothetical protein